MVLVSLVRRKSRRRDFCRGRDRGKSVQRVAIAQIILVLTVQYGQDTVTALKLYQ